MKKYFRALLLGAATLLGASVPAAAQMMPKLPADTAVRIGHLDNGLTYYIRHNNYPEGQADYFIAQKVGSILEDDNQRGLAHFLEHMCFNGTQTFPGNEMVSWLESVGVKFGANLNAYTGTDETVYYMSKVPTARAGVQDTCLTILRDWADGLLLEPEEIDKERNVIHEEWRRSNVGSTRIIDKLDTLIFKNSKYAFRSPIGIMEVVDNFKPQALRDYYEKWYRPDLQGIIVVGDINVDSVEADIKRIFSPIKLDAVRAERTYEPVPDTKGTIFALGNDKEQDRAIVQLMIKHDPIPDSLKSSVDYILIGYVNSMISSMLNDRLNAMSSSNPDTPFAGASVGYSNYMGAKTKDCLYLAAAGKGDSIQPAFAAAYRELLRAVRGGFTVSEYDRARQTYLSNLEAAYKNRNTVPSTNYAFEYVHNFTDNEPIPSIADRYELMQMIVPQLPVDMINATLKQYYSDDNRVLLGLFPDNGTYVMPTPQQMAAVMAAVEAEDIAAHIDEMKAEPLIEKMPAPGKIISEATDSLYGATVWTLSNGARVMFKSTDFKDNEIRFIATALGGISAYGPEDDINLRFFPIGIASSGLGSYTSTDLQKYLAGKQASLTFNFDKYSRVLAGSTVPKDLPTFMEILYMTLTDFNVTPKEYDASRAAYRSVLEKRAADPDYHYSKGLAEFLYSSPRQHQIEMSDFDNASRERIVDIARDQMADVNNFTFIFVGNVDADTLRPLIEQYIASIPARPSHAGTRLGFGITKGSATEITKFKKATPQTTATVILSADIPFNADNYYVASMAGQILSARLIKEVREDLGAVYSISARSMLDRLGESNATVISQFPMRPEMRDTVLTVIDGQLNQMAQAVTPDELAKVKEYMIKSAREQKRRNGSWAAAMAAYRRLPVDAFISSEAVINSITPEKIQDFVSEMLKQNNYRVYIQDPEPDAAPAE